MSTSLLNKMGIKDDMRIIFINAPAEVVELIKPPKHGISSNLVVNFDYIHFFTKSKEEFNRTFPKLKKHLKENGMLWASWPKGKQGGTDLTLQEIIKLGYDFGLVESKTISIDKIWSALKFTFPKKNKEYHNNFGKLR